MAPADGQEAFGSARDEHQLRTIIDSIPAQVRCTCIVDRIPGFVCTVKPTGEVESASRQIVEYFGRSVDNLRQWTMTDAVHPDDLPRAIAGWTRAIENGERYQIELRLRRADGVYRWFHLDALPVHDADGRILRWYGLLTDTEERKQVDEQLRRSEGFLLEAQRLSHTGSWRHDLSTGAVTTSPEMLRMWGVRPEEDSSAIEFWFDRIHPDDRLRVQGAFADSEREKRDYEADYRILLPDGAVRYHHSVGHAVVNEAGDLSEFVGTAMDVTEQWQVRAELEKANRALREREADLLEAQRLTHTGSWRHDVSLGTVTVTPEVHRIFAISPDEDASTADFFFNRIHPEDRAAEFDNYAKAQQTKRDFQSDYRIVLPDGSVRHIHNIGHPVLNESDEITAFVGTTRDVTEQVEARTELEQASAALRASEQRLRLAVDSIPGLICVMTATGEMDVVNQTFLDYAGKTAEEFDSWHVVVHPEDLQVVQRELERSLKAESPVDLEVRIRRSDGAYRWFHCRGLPLRSAEGRVVSWYKLLTDIDERKRAEDARTRAEAELLQARNALAHRQRVSMLGEVAASLAHEIRQPIAAARIDAKVCLRALADDRLDVQNAREAASRMVRDATWADEIIKRTTALYKKDTTQRDRVNVNAVIREMALLLQQEASASSIAIRTELAEGIPDVRADRVQLQQVLMNLMLNAIEAMQDTGGGLTVTSHMSEDSELLIAVRDTGVGLPADNPDQIFESFVTTKPHGTGMGLAITRSIVESHGGRLWAERNAGSGASFHFVLPTVTERES